MQNNNGNGEFHYTYSASEQAELRRIREKYESKEQNKMEQLRALDAGVTQRAQLVSLIFGVIGALVLGFGMSLVMSELPEMLGLSRTQALTIGVLVGAVGGVLVSLAYPMYNVVLKRERARVASEIIRLTDELMR